MKIAFLASPKPEAAHALQELTRRYGQSDLADADYLVTIGGDGTALKALHGALALRETPVFAMRVAGSVGALANRLEFAGLHQRLRNARHVSVHPLLAEARQTDGTVKEIRALNEIVLMRQKLQAAKLHISIAEAKLSADLTGDGLLVATPLGSTGYNLSAGGAKSFANQPGINLSRETWIVLIKK
jgi:NAD+ kinase